MMLKLLLQMVVICAMLSCLRTFRGVRLLSNPTKQHSLLFRHLPISTIPRGVGAGFYIPESSCEDDDEIGAEFYEIGWFVFPLC